MVDRSPRLLPISATIQLRFLDYRVQIDTNSLRIAAKLQSYFAAYTDSEHAAPDARVQAIVGAAEYDASRMSIWSRASSPGRAPKESYYDDGSIRFILKNRTGVLITLGKKVDTIGGPLEENTNQVVNLIGTLFGLSLVARGYVMVHASAIVDRKTGQAIAFLGNSGSGKSSLALQLIERGGYEFLSNDRVLLKSEGDAVKAVGLPKKPRVNPGTLLASPVLSRLVPRPRRRAYEQLAAEDLWKLEEKTDIDVEQDLDARSLIHAPLGRVYSLEWRRTGEGLTETHLGVEGAIDAMKVTAKDFGPYDLRKTMPDLSSEFRLIAERIEFVSIAGKSDPRGFAERWKRKRG